MPVGEYLGDDFLIALDTAASGAGSYASPTWAVQTSLGDAQMDPKAEVVEIPKRIATKCYKKGRNDWEFTFTMNYDPSNNTFHKKIRDCILSGARVHLAFAEGALASADYYHAWWLLQGPTAAQLDEAGSIEVTAVPHHSMGSSDAEIPAFVDAA